MSEEYLALPDGAGRFMQDSSGPALLRESRIVFFSSPYLDVSVQEVGFPIARNVTPSA